MQRPPQAARRYEVCHWDGWDLVKEIKTTGAVTACETTTSRKALRSLPRPARRSSCLSTRRRLILSAGRRTKLHPTRHRREWRRRPDFAGAPRPTRLQCLGPRGARVVEADRLGPVRAISAGAQPGGGRPIAATAGRRLPSA